MLSKNITLLFNALCSNFFEVNRDVNAIIVSDVNGLVIFGEKREEIDLEIISVLTSIINPVLERIRHEFAFKQFGTASFDTKDHRLLFISINQDITLSLVIDPMASIDKVSPYAYFLAEKTAQILEASDEDTIQLVVPKFEHEVENAVRLKDQIYQLRLDKGGKFRFKFIIIGDHEVGKTSIVRRFVEDNFSLDYRATIGLNVLTHTIEFLNNEVKFSIWDIGAQQFFKRFRRSYYQGAQAAFIVFDLTNEGSFKNIENWYDELDRFINVKQIPIVVIGNKSDLRSERAVDYQTAVNYINDLSEKFTENISYIETSALTGKNIKDAFNLISYHYIMKSKELEENRVKTELLAEIESILDEKDNLVISLISASKFWSPGLQILNSLSLDLKLIQKDEEESRKFYKYSNGLILKNSTFEKMDIRDSDGIFCILDARNKKHIDPEWREIIINIIESIKEKAVVLVGIRISDDTDWSEILEDFDVNEYLERKLVSLLFFKIGQEYRLEIFDQLNVMLNTINTFSNI
ncbi:MAG: GTP-binding protein [Candidatus Lokiarchaeota archaeon]|nr:GTP-binding protein [Candidatus Lokiarchaeota archaeon]MBD3201464.1 GTP-binding protein [Candidatus Lokiarchaeota archaeon]